MRSVSWGRDLDAAYSSSWEPVDRSRIWVLGIKGRGAGMVRVEGAGGIEPSLATLVGEVLWVRVHG